MRTLEDAVNAVVRTIAGLMVNHDWETLAAITNGHRLPADEFRTAIADYGRTLCFPPTEHWPNVGILKLDTPDEWSIWLPLWTEEEGESDLVLEFIIRAMDGAFLITEFSDLRVP